MLMRDYLPTDNGTDSTRVARGWFCTQDIGRLDAEGYLYLLERRQDVLEISGTRISCAQLERRLRDDGIGSDAAALVVESSRAGAHLVVAIASASARVPRESVTARLQQITSLPLEQITLLMLERLPRTSSGKPDRATLRRLAHVDDPFAQNPHA